MPEPQVESETAKAQLNVRVPLELLRELRVEAAQMDLRVTNYVLLILEKRKEILR